jgi:Family of unknown function (DUF6463)
MTRHSETVSRPFLSPGNAVMLVSAGHTAWGLLAYRKALREILHAGVVDSVGDGVFALEHSSDGRAAGFWFMLAAPLMALTGYLTEAALRSGEQRAVAVTGRTVLCIGVLGTTVMPRSGFPAVAPIGYWLMRSARRSGKSS